MSFKQINATELTRNPFEMIGKDWLLVTSKNGDRCNSMTASWGGVGIMWGKKVAYIFIRPQRYTKEFIDASDTLSLSVFDDSHRKMLNYMGSVSGREEDKIQKSGLTVRMDGDTPYFEEANTVFLCRKLYAQANAPECFIDKSCEEKWYPQKDYHTMYIVEIEKILIQE